MDKPTPSVELYDKDGNVVYISADDPLTINNTYSSHPKITLTILPTRALTTQLFKYLLRHQSSEEVGGISDSLRRLSDVLVRESETSKNLKKQLEAIKETLKDAHTEGGGVDGGKD